jgi:hypothetical protein
LSERFFEKVMPEPNTGCWLWMGANDNKRYGQIRANGRKGKLLKAHRVSWELHKGSIPPGMNVLHQCDNPPCVSPYHLFLGTLSDNSQDSVNKGRNIFQKHPEKHPQGESVKQSKLTVEQVKEIIKRHQDGNVTQTFLAHEYGVTPANISEIVRGNTWTKALQISGA